MNKGIILIVLSTITLSYGFYHLTLYYFPNYVYHKFYEKSTASSLRSENAFAIIEAPDENSRLVVKPNPDFAYGSAFYNLKDGPLQITGNMPEDTYWSLAFYQPNTINFYVKNDLQYESDNLDVLLVREVKSEFHREQIVAPSATGFILVRVLIADRSSRNQSRLVEHLQSLRIRQIGE